jgi:hypothetical protein
MSVVKVFASGNTLVVGSDVYAPNSGLSVSVSTEPGYTDYIVIEDPTGKFPVIAPYDEIYKADGTTNWGGTASATRLALAALFVDDNPNDYGDAATVATNQADLTALKKVIDTRSDVRGVYATDEKTQTESYLRVKGGQATIQGGSLTRLQVTEASPGVHTFSVGAGASGSETEFTALTLSGGEQADTAILDLKEGTRLAISNSSYQTKIATETLSRDRVISFPNKSGTVALTGDIPSVAGYVDTTGTPANNQVAVFTDQNTIEGSTVLIVDGVNEVVRINDSVDLSWNSTEGALDVAYDNGVTLQVGQEEHFYAKATEAISNGDIVMFAGAQGDHLLIAKADMGAAGFFPEAVIGVATQDFANNEFGYVTSFGKVRGLDTDSLDEGDLIYLDPDTPGGYVTSEPTPPDHIILVAAVTRSHQNEGTIFVRPSHKPDSDEIPEGSTNLFLTATERGKIEDIPATLGTAGQVLAVNSGGTALEYVDQSGGGGISDIVEDTTPQLGGNLDLNSNDITGTGDISIIGTIITSGSINSLSSISSSGNISGVNGTFTGNATFSGTLTAGTAILSGIQFTGGSTTSIGIATGLPNQPTDLQITSNGNVTVQLDADDNESSQHFKVLGSDGTILFQVDEDGISAGLLTTVTPTITGFGSSYQQGNAMAGTVSNYDSAATYVGGIYNSSGVLQTGNPVTIDSSGNITAIAPATVGTGYEMRITASGVGKLRSADAVATFDVTINTTFTHWRLQAYNSAGSPTADRIYLADLAFYTESNQTGTEYPTTNLTSNTSESGLTISRGFAYSGTYEGWTAMDSNPGSGWWTIGNSNASLNWLQLEFSTAKTFASVKMRHNQYSYADQVRIFGSNTGAFAGEEVLVAICEDTNNNTTYTDYFFSW